MEYKFKALTNGYKDFPTWVGSTASATFRCDVCGCYADQIYVNTREGVNRCFACNSAKKRSDYDMGHLKPLIKDWVREALREYFDENAG